MGAAHRYRLSTIKTEAKYMIPITDDTTIGQAFEAAVGKYGPNPLMIVPSNPERAYYPEGITLSYEKAGHTVAALAAQYRQAGYGDRKSTRLNSSHVKKSYAVFC